MTPNTEPARAEAEGALRLQVAAMVWLGLDLASNPPERFPAAVRELADLMLAAGEEPYSRAEACLLARIAQRRPDLQDPAAVDLSDPATEGVARELGRIRSCREARALARAQEVES